MSPTGSVRLTEERLLVHTTLHFITDIKMTKWLIVYDLMIYFPIKSINTVHRKEMQVYTWAITPLY